MKYIDADRLKAEIEKGTPNNLQLLVYRDIILSLIDSLQQEQQEVDLEGEITRFLSNVTKMNKGEWRGKYPIGEIGFRAVARHFYELGLRRAAEMYDEIEYNRQRANEEFSEKVCQ